MRRASLLRGIYLIVNDSPSALNVARASLNAGVRLVQYRAKRGVDCERMETLRALTHRYGALLFLNDDWQGAREYGCDGVHLGPDDDGFMAADVIRAQWPDAIVGFSCGNEEEMRRAQGADYAGVGSIFATSSKSDAGPPIGIDGLRRVAAAASLPVAAIGGITLANILEVKRAGVAMAAVLSAVSSAPDAESAAAALVRAWESPC